jgi:hypothetical protein
VFLCVLCPGRDTNSEMLRDTEVCYDIHCLWQENKYDVSRDLTSGDGLKI